MNLMTKQRVKIIAERGINMSIDDEMTIGMTNYQTNIMLRMLKLLLEGSVQEIEEIGETVKLKNIIQLLEESVNNSSENNVEREKR